MMRLDKFLNDILKLGRKDLHRIIKAGRVTVNGEVQSSPDHKIDEDADIICLDGEEIVYRKFVYYMMNKPKQTPIEWHSWDELVSFFNHLKMKLCRDVPKESSNL